MKNIFKISGFLTFFCVLGLVRSIAIKSATHHLSKRQIASSVCSSNTCRYGDCEIISQISYRCHCYNV